MFFSKEPNSLTPLAVKVLPKLWPHILLDASTCQKTQQGCGLQAFFLMSIFIGIRKKVLALEVVLLRYLLREALHGQLMAN
jgi:hypothetical protein